jgi:hypothetical protein
MKQLKKNDIEDKDDLVERARSTESADALVKLMRHNFAFLKELWNEQIFGMDDLLERAKGFRWKRTLEKLSNGLATALDDWNVANMNSKRKKVDPVMYYSQLSAPSTFGDRSKKEGTWVQSQQDSSTQVMCLRPVGFEGVHVSLMCPVFYDTVKVLESGNPSSLDWSVSAELAAIMGNPYNEESERLDAIRPILTNLLKTEAIGIDYGNISVRKKAGRNIVTDWTIRLGKSMILNLEIKNEKGSVGADPYMENIAYYVHFWAECGGPTRHCCPSLLVEIAGQDIGLSGAVWSQFPTIQPLSDNVPFLNATQDNRLRLRQARLIFAMRTCVDQLIQFYGLSHPLSDQCIFPYASSFTNEDGVQVRFKYEGFLLKDARKLLYLARDENGERVVVKFCPDRYGADAHRAMAELGYAPKLYACEEDGFMQMAVMEFLEGAQWYSPLHSSTFWDELKNSIQLYHKAGFVHGDLRAPNILVTNDGPRILDFDWAGKSGLVKYSRVLNQDIVWHHEADINERILPEHDVFMLDQLKYTFD